MLWIVKEPSGFTQAVDDRMRLKDSMRGRCSTAAVAILTVIA